VFLTLPSYFDAALTLKLPRMCLLTQICRQPNRKLRQQKRARLTNGNRPRGSRPQVTDTVQSTASSVVHSQPYSNHNAVGLSNTNTDLTNSCAEPVVNLQTVQATRVNLSAVHLTASTAAAATSSSSICTTTTTCSIVSYASILISYIISYNYYSCDI